MTTPLGSDSSTKRPKPPKAAMLVAQRIMRDIVRSGRQPGELLDPEHTMISSYDTGRGTLREALRLLEFHGVITLKPGPGGGPVLLDRGAASLAGSLTLLLQLEHAPYGALLDARRTLEPSVTCLAAERIGAEPLAGLARSLDALRSGDGGLAAFRRADRAFHEAIAWASENALFGHLISSISELLDTGFGTIELPGPQRAAIVRGHEAIYAALADHDPAAAERAMRNHLDDVGEYERAAFPTAVAEPISWDRHGARSGAN